MREALENVVLFKSNSAEEEGEALFEELGGKGVPHFFLTDAEGQVFDRWRGYSQPSDWLHQFEGALTDLSPIEAKIERFESEPTEGLAAALGRISSAVDDEAESVRYYRVAQELAADPQPWYSMSIFYSQYAIFGDETFDLDDLRAAADEIFDMNPGDDLHRTNTGVMLAHLASQKGDTSIVAPYLPRALEAAERVSGEDVTGTRSELAVYDALLIEGDKEKAYALKTASMPEGWQESAGNLNAVAWWCFENQVRLEEAEQMARKGIDLAEDPKLEAAILDTAAEICNLRDNCEEAVTLIARAIELDPENEYFTEQLVRFQELLAQKR